MGKGKKKKEGYSSVKLVNRRLPFQLPYMNPATNWGSSFRCLDLEMRRYQERHTHLQLHKVRAVRWQRIRTKTSTVRLSTSFLLLVASSSILTRIWWSGATDGSGGAIA